jgi:Protein of unknown function (DUF3999)
MKQLGLLGLLACLSPAWGQQTSPRDFAYGQAVLPSREAAVDSAGDAAAYRFALPLMVYQNTAREDLGDLRVFNAEGAVIAYSLSRPTTRSNPSQASVELPLFPLHEGARVSIDGVRVTINSAGSAVNLQTQNGTPVSTNVRQYLLDARAVDSTLSALQLNWPEGSFEYTGRLSIEVSEDLATWHLLLVAPIANLHANGQTLIENHVDLPATKAKFWRLTWLGAAPNFELNAVHAEPAAALAEPDRDSLDVDGVADAKNPREYVFDLGAHPPVSRINVLLPDANNVLDVEISSRPTQNAAWRSMLRTGVYRLKAADADQQNAALQVTSDTDRYWRARILGAGGSLRSPLRLHVEWIPNEVTFLSQGRAPFLLAYGNASATRTETDLSQLPHNLKVAPATLGPVQITGGASRLVPKPAPFPMMRAALWSVLVIAVALLGWMAYRISNESTGTK